MATSITIRGWPPRDNAMWVEIKIASLEVSERACLPRMKLRGALSRFPKLRRHARRALNLRCPFYPSERVRCPRQAVGRRLPISI
jgi:hypothetical protein